MKAKRLSGVASVVAVTFATIAVLGASSAHAQIEVSSEDGSHCPPVVLKAGHVVTGGCALHVVSVQTMDWILHAPPPILAEDLFSRCNTEFEARIDEAGMGYIYAQQIVGLSCGFDACDEAEGTTTPHANLPWPVRIEEHSPGNQVLHFVFCIREPGGAEGPGIACEVRIPFSEIDGSHQQQLGPVSETPCLNLDGSVEWSGHWVTVEDAAHPDIEVVHSGL